MKLKSGWIQHQWVFRRYWKGSYIQQVSSATAFGAQDYHLIMLEFERRKSYSGLAYRYFGKVFESTLLPSIVYKTLPPTVYRIFGQRRTRRINLMTRILTGQMKETSGTVIRKYSSLIQLQLPEGAC